MYPMVGGFVCLIGSLALLMWSRNGASSYAVSETTPDLQPPVAHDPRTLADYRWMSRMTLFSAWAAFAIVRSQFALLFIGFGYSESKFGVYLTLFALFNFATLTASGRWVFWHFRLVPLIVAQLMLGASLLMIVYGRTLSVFYPSAVVLGLAFGFAYSSHLYYGASMSRKRSVRMAIHEMVISLGTIIGAGTGGYLAKNLGPYVPYWFAIAIIGIGGFLQLIIHGVSLKKTVATGQQVVDRSGMLREPG